MTGRKRKKKQSTSDSLMINRLMPLLESSSWEMDLYIKKNFDSKTSLNFSEHNMQVCGLLFKVSLSCRHNEYELESFTKTLLRYACHLQFWRFMLLVLTEKNCLLLKKNSVKLKYSASSGNFSDLQNGRDKRMHQNLTCYKD